MHIIRGRGGDVEFNKIVISSLYATKEKIVRNVIDYFDKFKN